MAYDNELPANQVDHGRRLASQDLRTWPGVKDAWSRSQPRADKEGIGGEELGP